MLEKSKNMEKQFDNLDIQQVFELFALIDLPLIISSQDDHKIIYANHSAKMAYERMNHQLLRQDIKEFIKREFKEIYHIFLNNYEQLTKNVINEFFVDNTDLTDKISKFVHIQVNRILYFDRIAFLLQIHRINPNLLIKNKFDVIETTKEQQLVQQVLQLNQSEQKNIQLSQKIVSLENQKQNLQNELIKMQERITNDALHITSLTQEIEILKNDIDTKTQEFEHEIIKKNRELTRIQNELSDFTNLQSIILANLGHELRTPLNGILGFAQLIEIEEISEQVYNDVQLIKKSANRLKSTLDNLLLLSEIDSHEKQINFMEFELKHIEDFVSSEYYELAKIKKINFEVNVRNPNDLIKIDTDLMQVVFDVILDNAFKFTSKGFIRIDTEEYNTDKGNYVLLKFKDTGCGIPKEKVDLVFKPFRQGSVGYRREFQGVGIGLSIAKKILELMESEIGLISTLGKGTSIIIQIPKISKQL